MYIEHLHTSVTWSVLVKEKDEREDWGKEREEERGSERERERGKERNYNVLPNQTWVHSPIMKQKPIYWHRL